MRGVIFLLAAFLFIAPVAVAQPAGKIVNQAAKAMGGEEALRRVTSWEVFGVITRKRDGATGQFKAAAAKPNLYTMNFEIAGFETGAGFTGKSSWRRDRRDGLRTLTGDASDNLQAEAFHRNNRWLDYKKHRAKIVYSGAATVNGAPRRERFRNRDVIVADFEPNPDIKPVNSNEVFAHNLTGSIWVDEKDLQIARVEFQLVNAFKVAGGAFFAMRKGSRFVAEQDRFFDEVWLPTYTEVTISARAMLFASFGINQKVTYGDYRRFNVQSEEKRPKT